MAAAAAADAAAAAGLVAVADTAVVVADTVVVVADTAVVVADMAQTAAVEVTVEGTVAVAAAVDTAHTKQERGGCLVIKFEDIHSRFWMWRCSFILPSGV